MDSSFTSSPRRAYDLPKPETGLAEWTSKIKALQREVDADEEAEQRRLEEEITAAREARLRRSRGMGGGSRADSLDLSAHKEKLSALDNPNDMSSNDTPKSVAEREAERETSLRKLMEKNDVYNPDKIARSNRGASEKSDPVSLAAFIGGRATGPRLNKHAPQQDAHDPTQFVQPDLSAPHPVFGRGGIAMPGMAPKKDTKSPSPIVGSESSERYRPTSVKTSTSVASSYLEKIEQANKKDTPDIHRHSYTGLSKSLSVGIVDKPVQKAENSPGFSKPKPLSSPVSSYLQTKSDAPIVPDVRPTVLDSPPTNTSIPDTSPALPQRGATTSLSSEAAKMTTSSASNQNTSGSTPKYSHLPSYLSKKEEAQGRNSPTMSSTPAGKTATSFAPSQNTLSSTPKSNPLPSYLPKKEEAQDRNSSSVSKSPTNVFQSNSTTSTKLPSYLSANKTTSVVTSASTTSTTDTPLRRIMERNNVYNPDKIVTEESRKPVTERAHVSLASFIGGSAKGPRLNRHAPQQDVHDPTQFVQPDLSAPHPVFGSGGIAMPGMTARRNTAPASDTPGVDSSELQRPSLGTKPTWPPAATKPVEKAFEAPVSAEKTGNRERTTSAPGTQVSNVSASQSSGAFSSNRLAGRQSPIKETATPLRDRTISGPAYPQGSIHSARASVSTPSLARPIQPIPKSSSLSPQIPITSPSPAFQKPPPPKELTPSISRLQGRGFVQNMIKATSQFESSPSPTPSPEKSRPSSASGKKGSVLDRWQPAARSTSPTKSTFPVSVTGIKRSSTQDPLSDFGVKPTSQPSFTDGSHVIKATASMPSLIQSASVPGPVPAELPRTPEPYQRSRTPGLGSATTMVLIKPSQPQIPHVDELGVKHDPRQESKANSTKYVVPSELPPSSKKPLIHPTKDRARKPRKQHENQSQRSQSSTPPSPSADSSRKGLEESIVPPTSVQIVENRYEAQPDVFNDGVGDKNQQIKDEQLKIAVLTSEDVGARDLKPRPTSPILESLPNLKISTPEDIAISSSPRSPPLPSSPMKHTRIPSTGKRPTVMELAQTLLETPVTRSPTEDDGDPTTQSPVERSPKPRSNLSQIQAEKRRSNYERYSALILPPLKEEATPTPSPAGTLARDAVVAGGLIPENDYGAQHDREEESPETPSPQMSLTDKNSEAVALEDFHDLEEPHYLSISDVDLDKLLIPQFKPPKPAIDFQTISVEVLAITGTTATPVSMAFDVFYETEILVIIHRVKSRSRGLASTSVWCWLGKKSTLGDREERKVHELAQRYRTKAVIAHQLAEPAELVQVLGGRLAIRQGSRLHWTPENTTMHLVRSFRDVVLIDEHDLDIRNLCSGFSYCFTILGSIYVWNGRGSTQRERASALQYATTFSADSIIPTVLTEGEDDDDEMFWMILGYDGFANADYWRWRSSSTVIDPSVWKIDIGNSTGPVSAVEFISMQQSLQNAIYIINCIWEFFVLVGREARSDRLAIKFALDVAKELSIKAAFARPYVPTLHVLILPSQLPLDLRHGIRDLEEAWVNDGEIPDHMNLLHYSEAVNHLSTSEWPHETLKDPTMLPLGVGGGI